MLWAWPPSQPRATCRLSPPLMQLPPIESHHTNVKDMPLRGLGVLDIGTMIAGPFAATLMADFGADVIKVEHPTQGDPLRGWPPIKNGQSLWWKVIARNKQLLSLNLSHREGQAILRELAREADVLIENFRPKTLERWDLGPEVLHSVNPRLVVARVSGYGQSGPYSRRPGYATIAEAYSGIPSFTGFSDKPPTLSAFPLGDYVAALFAFSGIMMALREAEATGCGQVVDTSLYEPLFRLVESQVVGYDQLGLVKTRRGNRMDEDSPRNAYATSDGEWVVISTGSNRTFDRLARAIGRPELAQDPRFIDNPARVVNGDELDAIIAEWIQARELHEVLATFEEHDVVAGVVYDIRRIFEDPHYAARENIITIRDEDFGALRMQGVVPLLSRTPGQVRHTGRSIGHDSEEILRRLGLSEAQIAALRRERVT